MPPKLGQRLESIGCLIYKLDDQRIHPSSDGWQRIDGLTVCRHETAGLGRYQEKIEDVPGRHEHVLKSSNGEAGGWQAFDKRLVIVRGDARLVPGTRR